MSQTLIILLFLGLPLLAGIAVPFFRERPLLQRAIWLLAAIPTIGLIYLWLGLQIGRGEGVSVTLAGAATAFWIIAGVVGLLVGREAANVRRDANNTREKRKAAEIFR